MVSWRTSDETRFNANYREPRDAYYYCIGITLIGGRARSRTLPARTNPFLSANVIGRGTGLNLENGMAHRLHAIIILPATIMNAQQLYYDQALSKNRCGFVCICRGFTTYRKAVIPDLPSTSPNFPGLITNHVWGGKDGQNFKGHWKERRYGVTQKGFHISHELTASRLARPTEMIN